MSDARRERSEADRREASMANGEERPVSRERLGLRERTTSASRDGERSEPSERASGEAASEVIL